MPTEKSFDRQEKSAAQEAKEAYDQVKSKFGPAGGKKEKAEVEKPAKEEYIAEHEVESGDTLSAIAVQYYGSGGRDEWMTIYEANKETIGDNPSLIKVGQVLKIPPLN